MRVPENVPHRERGRRRGIWLLLVLGVVLVLVLVLQGLAGFYTNYLWFHWTGLGTVWRTVVGTKVVLAATFVVIAFALLASSFWLVDKIAPRAMFMAPDTELVRRYQGIVGPHAFALRNALAAVVALALGIGTSAQWQHWLLFENPVAFGRTDPLFGRDASFFVFRLPFLEFLVDWVLVALLVTVVLSAVGHFLNGAIRLQGSPRIEPRALAHLSLLLGLMALVKAWAYYYVDRFTLDLSDHGVVNGASYTDVHVRLPALTLLSMVALIAFVLLVFNVYQRNWTLPIVAVGLWAFVAIAVGVVYPALVQAFRVTPSQSTLELPYIERNISATRYAMGIGSVSERKFPANQDLTPTVLKQYSQTLDDAVLWDPSVVAPTFEKYQDIHSYYTLTSLAVDRYVIDGVLEPVVTAVRELETSALPNQTWADTHLVYTHGYGAVVAQANSATVDGTPDFVAGNLPPTSASKALRLREPGVFYAPGQDQYVVVQTRQPEVDYQAASGNQSSDGRGSGGVPIGSFFSRAAFAIHLHDFNLLVSNLLTSRSRILPVTGVRTAVEKALPFLRVDAHPYAVVAHGQLFWMVDAYAVTNDYPYAQPAANGFLPAGSGLAGSYDYVRDAVKVVMNAHSGAMRFYTVDAKSDPLIESYERAFPGLFQPMSKMNPALRQHLRYPQDLLMVQAAMYGRYHVAPSEAALFYSESAAWDISQTSTSVDGEPSRPLEPGPGGTVASFTPVYELLQLPGERGPTFNAVEPLVPYAKTGSVPTLKALLVADSSAERYGSLESFVTPADVSIAGPGLANSEINSSATVSKQLTLLGQVGSVVSLGAVQILPIAGSLLYVRPLYVSSAQTQLPELRDVVILYGQQVVMAPTLDQALAELFGASAGSAPQASTGRPSRPSSSGASAALIPGKVRKLVADAASAFAAGQKDLTKGDLGGYQHQVLLAGKDLSDAQRLLSGSGSARTRSKVVPKVAPVTRSVRSSPSVRAETTQIKTTQVHARRGETLRRSHVGIPFESSPGAHAAQDKSGSA